MEQARAAEDAVMRGDRLGPLHGLPVPIKDTQMTAGVRTPDGRRVARSNRMPPWAAPPTGFAGTAAPGLGRQDTVVARFSSSAKGRAGDGSSHPNHST